MFLLDTTSTTGHDFGTCIKESVMHKGFGGFLSLLFFVSFLLLLKIDVITIENETDRYEHDDVLCKKEEVDVVIEIFDFFCEVLYRAPS